MDTNLANALARLKDFRASWNADDAIDEESRLTAADLDTIIEALEGQRQPAA